MVRRTGALSPTWCRRSMTSHVLEQRLELRKGARGVEDDRPGVLDRLRLEGARVDAQGLVLEEAQPFARTAERTARSPLIARIARSKSCSGRLCMLRPSCGSLRAAEKASRGSSPRLERDA
jgi:hypothetical protein